MGSIPNVTKIFNKCCNTFNNCNEKPLNKLTKVRSLDSEYEESIEADAEVEAIEENATKNIFIRSTTVLTQTPNIICLSVIIIHKIT